MTASRTMLAAARQALAAGDVAAGMRMLDDEIALQPEDPHLRVEAAALLWDLYEFDEGTRHHRHLKQLALDDPLPLMQAAKGQFSIGRFAVAAELLDAALKRHPSHPDLLALLGSALDRAGQAAPAREAAIAALRIDPAHARALRLLAHLDFTGGDPEAARERIQQHLKHYPGADDWRLRQELAGVLDRLGDPEAAMAELTAAKGALATAAEPFLQESRRLRQRQWELTRRITAADWQRWHASDASSQPDLVLMAGFPRSGTTLLERVCTSHPGCIGTDESGVLFSQFIRPIIHDARTTEEAFLELDGFAPEDLASGRECYAHCTAAFLGEAIAGRTIIDKEPLHTADLPLSLRLFPNARLLMPLRDPRDVVISFFFTMVPLAPNSAAAVTLEESCRFYADTMRHWLHLRPLLPHPALAPRYEDLVADPTGSKRGIFSFLGLDDHAEASPASSSPRIGGRTPTYHDVTQPIYSRALGRWKKYERWLAPHLPLLEPFVKAFGYED